MKKTAVVLVLLFVAVSIFFSGFFTVAEVATGGCDKLVEQLLLPEGYHPPNVSHQACELQRSLLEAAAQQNISHESAQAWADTGNQWLKNLGETSAYRLHGDDYFAVATRLREWFPQLKQPAIQTYPEGYSANVDTSDHRAGVVQFMHGDDYAKFACTYGTNTATGERSFGTYWSAAELQSDCVLLEVFDSVQNQTWGPLGMQPISQTTE